MTAKEKAEDLISKMCGINCTEKNINRMIYPALKAVDEILKVFLGLEENTYSGYYDYEKEYWEEVKKEIEKI